MKLKSLKLVSFLFILPALLPVAVSGIFLLQRMLIRIAMEERLELEQLETIRIPVNQIRWYEEGKELIIDGEMFDVKKLKIHLDTAIITGLFDAKEKEINAQLQGVIDGETNRNSSGDFLTCFNFSFNAHSLNYSISSNSYILKPVARRTDISLYDIFLPVATPPPIAC